MSEAAPCRRCGHGREAHEHLRRGTDCALCGCPRFSGGPGRRALRLVAALRGRSARG